MIEGVYWFDDQTIHYLKKESPSGTSYWIGYSMKFSFEMNRKNPSGHDAGGCPACRGGRSRAGLIA